MAVSDPSGGDIRRRLDLAEAVELTANMRSERAGVWRELRQRIESEGWRPLDAAVGALIPDDVDQHFGVVLIRSGEAFLFETERDRRVQPVGSWAQQSSLTIWNQLTNEGKERYVRWLRAARWVLDSGLD